MSKLKYKLTISITTITLLIDILTKQLIINNILENQTIKLINNFLYLTYVKNTGIAFSFLENQVPLIILLTIAIILIIIKYILKNELTQYEVIFYSLVLGGAIGNLIDRIVNNYVIDFIEVHLLSYHFPIFNLADTFIVIGIFFLIITNIKKESSDKNVINRNSSSKNR